MNPEALSSTSRASTCHLRTEASGWFPKELGLVRWRADGKELLYLGPDGGLMAVALNGGSVFQPGPPQLLFKLPPEFLRLSSNPGALADVSRDNQKILLSIPAQEGARQALSVVLNWQAVLAK
jgi:hypothetical protein